MISPKTRKWTPIPNDDLAAQLNDLGLLVTAQGLAGETSSVVSTNELDKWITVKLSHA